MKTASLVKLTALTFALAGLSAQTQLHGQSTNGLIAYFPFDGNANDASGNGHHGVPVGATLTADRYGHLDSAYHFDGYSNFISVASGGALSFDASTESYTVVLWAKMDGLTNRWGNLYLIGDRPFGLNTYVSYNMGISLDTPAGAIVPGTPSGTFANTIWNGPGRIVHDPAPLSVGQWYSLALVVVANQSQTLFVNGRPVASADIAGVGKTKGNNGDILIGATWFPGSEYQQLQSFNGDIDDVRIYSRALSEVELRTLATEAQLSIAFSQVRVCWESLANRTYQVQYSSALTSNTWVNFGIPIPGNDGTQCVTDDIVTPQRFYRVVPSP
ncbi:MAG TPA: LamG domain-containing protein [Verrucomicrobiae bacterium]